MSRDRDRPIIPNGESRVKWFHMLIANVVVVQCRITGLDPGPDLFRDLHPHSLEVQSEGYCFLGVLVGD